GHRAGRASARRDARNSFESTRCRGLFGRQEARHLGKSDLTAERRHPTKADAHRTGLRAVRDRDHAERQQRAPRCARQAFLRAAEALAVTARGAREPLSAALGAHSFPPTAIPAKPGPMTGESETRGAPGSVT